MGTVGYVSTSGWPVTNTQSCRGRFPIYDGRVIRFNQAPRLNVRTLADAHNARACEPRPLECYVPAQCLKTRYMKAG